MAGVISDAVDVDAVVIDVADIVTINVVNDADVFRSKQGLKFKLAGGKVFSKCNFQTLPQFNDLTGHGKSRRLKETREKNSAEKIASKTNPVSRAP